MSDNNLTPEEKTTVEMRLLRVPMWAYQKIRAAKLQKELNNPRRDYSLTDGLIALLSELKENEEKLAV